MSHTVPLSAGERAELERLRAEVAALRARPAAGGHGAARSPGRGRRLRTVGATLVIVLGCVLAPFSVVTTWLDTQVTDTDAYVKTVAPLIEDPAVQRALSAAVTNAVFDALGIEETTTAALSSLAGRTDLPPEMQQRIEGLAVPIVSGVQGFVRTQVNTVVGSDQFAVTWAQANAIVHRQLVAVLTGDTREGVSVVDGQVSIDIAPFVELVKERLVERGVTVAERIPTIHRSFVLFTLPNLPAAQTAFGLLNTAGAVLPYVTVLVLAGGVLLARNRRRALVGAGIGIAASMLVLGAVLALARTGYLNAVPPDLLAREPAARLYDTLVRFLRTGLRATFVVGVVVAAVAYLTGPSAAAVGVRRGLSRGLTRVRELSGAPGGLAGPRLGARLGTYRTMIRIVVLVLAALVILFWDRPTPADVIVVAGVAALLLVVLEVLAAPAAAPLETVPAPPRT
ncbi:hypothetical protein [Georgenia sp. SYP-B2076]|uniref:hypothetical protein n=1 Tax=Georgenia sp. SYP-B2076 TaxID=2495881 RepID=UPI0013DF2E9E|nr:hypothetical protein [Georgenia sp. SYP-B2076]